MEFDGQAKLAYQLPEFDPGAPSKIPVTPSQLETWLSELPLMNIKQLVYQLPKYIQELNRINISDKYRLDMLEQLRTIVAHVSDTLIKRFRGANLSLSVEFQELQWLLNVLISEMAIGYKRLLFNVANKNPSWFNRKKFILLAQRVSYYLGEIICLSYLLSTSVPRHVWFELNSTYSYSRKLQLNKRTVKDKLAYMGMKKGSIDSIYNRVLLLTLVSPYSLRSAELEQIYYGLLPWLNKIKLVTISQSIRHIHVLNLKHDSGPEFQSLVRQGNDGYIINCSELVQKLDNWIETGDAPKSSLNKGMSKKLLIEITSKLDSIKQRSDERISHKGEQVEVVIGLQNIDLFLSHISSLGNKAPSPIPKIEVDNSEIVEDKDEVDLFWGDKDSEVTWDKLTFHTNQNASDKKPVRPMKRPKVRRHIFEIENESQRGACLSCSHIHGSGLYIGELMFLEGSDSETWTLGIIQWMTVKGKKLEIGLYLLSSQVDQVVVSQDSSAADITTNALWLGAGEHGDTILLPSAEFKIGDDLQLDHNGDEIDVVLGNVVWQSEGFSQFCMIVQEIDLGDELDSEDDFLIPTWAK